MTLRPSPARPATTGMFYDVRATSCRLLLFVSPLVCAPYGLRESWQGVGVQRDGLTWGMLSPDQQEKLITKHLTYEVRMLLVSARLLTQETAPRDEHRVALEAFLLHARLLHEFLATGRKKTDDLRAHHYAPDWPDVAPSIAPELEEDGTYEALHKWLAHLTTRRLDVKVGRSWPVRELGDDLARRLAAWVKAVPDYRRPWLAEIQQHLAEWRMLSARIATVSDVVTSTASGHAPLRPFRILHDKTN